MFIDTGKLTIQPIHTTWLPKNISAAMLRLDTIHPVIQGNKWFKLKENIAAMQAAGQTLLLTFGGPYSNHIAATAAACQALDIRSIGVIRGEAPNEWSNTLIQAKAAGMQLEFVSRRTYREKENIDWAAQFPGAYIVPEGGNNALGVKGSEDILLHSDSTAFTHILAAVGTGTTLAGLVNAAQANQCVWGYSALKGSEGMEQAVAAYIHNHETPWKIWHDVSEGYGKTSQALFDQMNDFYWQTGIPTDIVYTGKLLLAWQRQLAAGVFPGGSNILVVHTGGLQGNLSLPPNVLDF
ncbi:1-aminocyclopropane-1-carboxylate deaminase/D-cysteine desulfhydrase [Chitinophaga skermanii]|uniref:1-aminocyclopropane-1-carboxylate deaminase/D-cysteine desulfhydrase n=1 Tax=Chitinophaga skermanii TaxID=331697 RepID=A0A327QLD7_9BACT|nr:pyridoxal-phosphate dependent enzyme [Chitinophaga skermanii]RAJ02567.1 1-aminocyclopropane-1-carboxylate deaminase/D-cysteine desulfhydrase [Chitinophaga skermanii]